MSEAAHIVIRAADVFLPDLRVEPVDIFIEGGSIASVGDEPPSWPASARVIAATGCLVAPGFIDIHHHGAAGRYAGDADPDALAEIAAYRATTGCTAFLASFAGEPESIERVVAAWESVNDRPLPLARFVGVHFEGPFLSAEMPGAAELARLLRPDLGRLREMLDAAGQWPRIVSLAPEMEGGLELVAELRRRGIVPSIGHSNATFGEVMRAIEAGASHVTHSYNAMRGLHHREPGVVGAMLVDDRLTGEIIADGVHVHPAAVRLLLRAKGPDGVALITDGSPMTGMPRGEYERPDGRTISVDETSVRLPNGRLAGSKSPIDRNLRLLVNEVGISPAEAVLMATEVPARIAHVLSERGTIEAGKRADLVILSRDLEVQATLVGGRFSYVKPRFDT